MAAAYVMVMPRPDIADGGAHKRKAKGSVQGSSAPSPEPSRELAGGGEMGRRVRALDWSKTPLGPLAQWPSSLRSQVCMTLEMCFPTLMAFGDALTVVYNDGYAKLLRGFPDPLGKPFRDSWPMQCEQLDPLVERALAGEATTYENLVFSLQREGKPERAYFDICVSPLRNEAGAAVGFMATGAETTARVKHRAHLAEIFERAAVALSELSLEGRFLYVNDALCRLLGRSRSEVLSASIVDVTHPEDVQRSLRAVDRLIEWGEPVAVDKRYLRPDGTVILANSALTRIDDEQGRPLSVLAVTVDQTERQQAAEALRREAARNAFRIALSDALRPLGSAIDIQKAASCVLGQHLRVNRAMYVERVDVSDEVLIQYDYCVDVPSLAGRHDLRDYGSTLLNGLLAGRTVVVSDVTQDRELTRAQRAGFAAVGVASYVAVPMLKDGRLAAFFNVHQAAPRVFTADEVALIEETAERAWDAVQRGHAEAALRRSERRLQLALDASGLGIWEVDLATDSVEWSEKVFEIVGVSRERYDASVAAQRRLIHPDDTALDAAMSRAVREHTQFSAEYRIVRPDRQMRWVASHGCAEYDAQGQPVRTVGTLADITERKRREVALRENDRRKDEFLATLAHELRNPLAPLRNALEILRLSGGDSGADKLHAMMSRQVDILSRLVDDLLEVSRITRGAIELRKERVDVARVVRAALETSAAMIERAEQDLVVSLPGEPLLVEADSMRLAQVFGNLLNNAARYANGKGEIRVTASRDGHDAVVSIKDTGVGIAKETLPRIFEMFAQGDRSAGTGQGGLGIGLTLVRSLLRMHGGSVEAHSEGVGKGAEFIVRLPLAPEVSKLKARVEDAAATSVPATRVLVVDDNQDAADTAGALLELLGAQVCVAYDGPSALARFAEFAPAVVLLDLGMPGMDGFAVARQLRQHPQGQDAILVALTGWGQEEDRRRTREAGFQHHMVKPPDLRILQAVLASAGGTQDVDSLT